MFINLQVKAKHIEENQLLHIFHACYSCVLCSKESAEKGTIRSQPYPSHVFFNFFFGILLPHHQHTPCLYLGQNMSSPAGETWGFKFHNWAFPIIQSLCACLCVSKSVDPTLSFVWVSVGYTWMLRGERMMITIHGATMSSSDFIHKHPHICIHTTFTKSVHLPYLGMNAGGAREWNHLHKHTYCAHAQNAKLLQKHKQCGLTYTFV